nr:CD48 antigen-like [Misgurnus anguillicaudatus]
MQPSKAALHQSEVTPQRDMLKACIGFITQGALVLTSKPLGEISGTREGIIHSSYEEDELGLWSSPNICPGVFGSQFVSVMEGDSVTLSVNVTESQIKEGIYWKFGPNKTSIANIKNYKTTIYNDTRLDGRFKNRLHLNNQTGSLTIKNTSITHTGLYHLTTKKQDEPLNIFNITVYAHLPGPVITRDSSQCSSSLSSNCSLLCSVFNVKDVSLSWYKVNSLLSSISVSDLNIRLSLHLEVEYQDNNTYSCVVNNPITNQTQHLNITQLCQTCSAVNFCYCGFTEAVIRLVVSVLVGVAAVALLVYDITSRKDEEKRIRSKIQIKD